MRSKLLKLFLFVLFVGALATTVVGYRVYSFLNGRPGTDHTEKIITIPKGAPLNTIARLLEEEGVLTDASSFNTYVRLKKAGNRLKAGELRFFTDLTPPQVLDVLLKGDEVRYRLTFPEGYNIKEMAGVVATVPFLSGEKFLSLAQDPAVASSFDIEAPTLEGYLYPSTYEVARTQDEKSLLGMMVRQFKQRWTSEMTAAAKKLKLNQLKVLTLASIIEKETAHQDERPTVSSVYHNRLKKHMKLEADPTIIYGLENYDGNIHKSDIRRKHPWNTYVITGLPPTPIANPSLSAIQAALNPADTEYLYFVAMGDRRHSFSRTLEEHERKVDLYQRRSK